MNFFFFAKNEMENEREEKAIFFLKNSPVIRDGGFDVLGKSFEITSKFFEFNVGHSCDDRKSWRWWRSKPRRGSKRAENIVASLPSSFPLLILNVRMTRAYHPTTSNRLHLCQEIYIYIYILNSQKKKNNLLLFTSGLRFQFFFFYKCSLQ